MLRVLYVDRDREPHVMLLAGQEPWHRKSADDDHVAARPRVKARQVHVVRIRRSVVLDDQSPIALCMGQRAHTGMVLEPDLKARVPLLAPWADHPEPKVHHAESERDDYAGRCPCEPLQG